MSFLSPLALLGLLFLPAVVAMYLLKLRRDEQVVPSTLLWQRLVADVEANAPWQRLRRSLLLLLQLLLVLIFAALAARPFLERPAGLSRDLVLVIDTSASMAATDVVPDRLTVAKGLALEALRDLPAGGKVSVVAAGRTARVVVNATTDIGRVRAAVENLAVTPAAGDLGDALNLADALAARSTDAEILVATDGALARPPTSRLEHAVSVLGVGRDRQNQAIVALAVRAGSSGVTRSVFVSVANLSLATAQRRLQLYGDGVLLEARDIVLDPQTRSEAIIDDVPAGVRVVEVRLAGAGDGTGGGGGTASEGAGDDLALDDRAWAIVPPERPRKILLVSEGDPYLETALSFLPATELYGVAPDAYGPATHPELFDLVIFEGEVPDELPAAAVLAIAPVRSSALGEVTGTLRDPRIGSLDPAEPLLRYVDLSTTHVGTAMKLALPAWARAVIPGPGGAPLLYAGELDGRRTAVLAFEPRQSDLPLQVAFPILVANLAGELLGGSAAPADAVAPGDPVSLPIPAGATGLLVLRPDGSRVDLLPGSPGAASVQFSQTDQLGAYSAEAIFPDGAPTPAPTSGPAEPARFAVDLFDPSESNIAPGSGAAIEALGAAGAAGPGAGAGPDADDRPPARDELWTPILLLALAALLVEWLVYQRDAVLRLGRGLRSRLARSGTAAQPAHPGGRGRGP